MGRKLVSILLAFCLVLSLFTFGAVAADSDYTDMPEEGSWSYDALASSVENGLLQGTGGRLMPEGNLTRAQLAAIINRAFGADEEADISGYSDVKTSAWYYDDIAKAVRMGTLQGDGSTMRPDDPVTRQEAFIVLARAFKLTDGNEDALSAFSDFGQAADWAAPLLAAMVGAGYINGIGGKLNPTFPISREEFAQVLYNMVSVYLLSAGDYTADIDGNAVISAPGVTLSGVTISGDLIIGEGVGDGDVMLDGVTVEGRIVVRGGGENSIHIINNSDVGSIIVGKTGDGSVRILTEEGCRVQVVYIDDGRDDIILEGVYNEVTVTSDTPVKLKDAKVTILSVASKSAAVTLEGKSTVTVANIKEAAGGSTVTVESGSKIALVESAAPEVTIQGDGTVTEAKISGNNTAVNTKNTDITVSEGTTGVTENGNEVTPGGSTPGGSTGGGTSSTAVVHNEADFISAAKNSAVKTIVVADEFTIDEDVILYKPVTIDEDGALGIGTARLSVYSTVTNNGILATVSEPADGVEGYLCVCVDAEDGTIGKVVNNGTYINNGVTELNAVTSVENNGTFSNAGVVAYIDMLGLDEQDPSFDARYEAVRIENITDNGGSEKHIATVFGINALYAAIEADGTGTDPFYCIVSLLGDGVTFTASDDITVRAEQRFFIEMDTTLIVPAGKSFTLSESAQMEIYGSLTIEGTATNDGTYFRMIGGVINGTITDGAGGKHYNAYQAADSSEWTAALSDTHCCYIEITGNVEISEDTDIGFGVSVGEGAMLTVANGKTLTLTTIADKALPEPYMEIIGTLINNGTIVIQTGNGIFVADDGALTNSGVIDTYGWMNVDPESLGGTVNFYACLTDIARKLWYQLGGILTNEVNEATDYDTYADALAEVGEDDADGRYSLVWLFKNEILPTENFDPYGYADETEINALLNAFALEVGKPYSVTVTGGVCTSDGVDERGSSLDQLISSFAEGLDVGTVSVSGDEAESDLVNYMDKNYIQEIHITSDIDLAGNLSITKRVVIDAGCTLTAYDGGNITVQWRDESDQQGGCCGILVVDGTLVIPEESNLINMAEVDLSGTMTNNGAITNMSGEDGRWNGNFYGDGGTLTNNGTLVTNGYMELHGTALSNSGVSFTNNGNLVIYGGSVTSTATFHNAGYLKIVDKYGLESGSVNEITSINFNTSLTNNSQWIDYTAAIYSAGGLAAARAAQDEKTAALGDGEAATGLETYNRLDIMADIELSESFAISGWEVWVVAETEQNVSHSLTIGSGVTLSVVDDYNLHVEGALINNGAIILGAEDRGGALFVWPTGTFTNNGTVNNTYGRIYRMDEYLENGSEGLKNSGVITGFAGAMDLAIVHDWAALYDAAVTQGMLYEEIDIMGEDFDITLESNLTVNADLYVEWNDGIRIPQGISLTLAGDHRLNNRGDIWVLGSMTVDEDYEVSNEEHIQVYGSLINKGIIYNYNWIDLMPGGGITGDGILFTSADGLTNNGGTVSCGCYQMVQSFGELTGAMEEGMPALVTGGFELEDDLVLTEDVTVGLTDGWNGHLHTRGHTLTVDSGVTLAVDNGELEINENGSVVNNGTMTFGPQSGLRILADGIMSTSSDVHIFGWLDLYNWETQHDYIDGAVYNYGEECGLIQLIYSQVLYTTGEESPVPTGLQPDVSGVAGLAVYTGFDEETELVTIGSGITGWGDLAGDTYSRYAYAALHENGLVGNSIDPYHKLTYQEAKALMSAVAAKLGIGADEGILDFLAGLPDTGGLICNNNFVYDTASQQTTSPSDFDQLCKDFKDAVHQALNPTLGT